MRAPKTDQDFFISCALDRASKGDANEGRRAHQMLYWMLTEYLDWRLTPYAKSVLAEMHGLLSEIAGPKDELADQLLRATYLRSEHGNRRTIGNVMRDLKIAAAVDSLIDFYRVRGKKLSIRAAAKEVASWEEFTAPSQQSGGEKPLSWRYIEELYRKNKPQLDDGTKLHFALK